MVSFPDRLDLIHRSIWDEGFRKHLQRKQEEREKTICCEGDWKNLLSVTVRWRLERRRVYNDFVFLVDGDRRICTLSFASLHPNAWKDRGSTLRDCLATFWLDTVVWKCFWICAFWARNFQDGWSWKWKMMPMIWWEPHQVRDLHDQSGQRVKTQNRSIQTTLWLLFCGPFTSFVYLGCLFSLSLALGF